MAQNTIGTIFKVTTFGESHGAALGCIVDGVPAGIAIDPARIQAELDKRRPGQTFAGSNNAAVTSNKVSLTQDTDAIIVSSANPLMRGKVIVSYIIDDDPNRNTAYNMLSFGFGLFSAPYVREVSPRSMHGGEQKEVHVNPRWQYYPTLPIVAEFSVTGIDEAIEKNIFNTVVLP